MYKSNRDLLLQSAEQVFRDAAKGYSQLPVVEDKFGSPYVRLELLKWDALHEDMDVIDMDW